MIRRREFMTLLGGAAAWPLAVSAQQGARLRRIGMLIGGVSPRHQQFLCRHCAGLAYASQYEQPWKRAYRRVDKLKQRLGITSGGLFVPLPGKPRYITADRYAHLLDELLQAEIGATEACTAQIQRLAARVGKRGGHLHRLKF
jgi:hypothetical protein